MLIAPTERHPITTLGKTSSLPEQYGVDILFPVQSTWVGIQRKEINDLVASVYDGRLARELAMMKRCTLSVLVVEGKPQWTMDGELMGRSQYGNHGNGKPGKSTSKWTRSQHRGLLNSVRSQGVWTDSTESASDTVDFARGLETWLKKEKHGMLHSRPGPETIWGSPTNRDYARHLIMGLPGVGGELADRILDQLGIPFGWCVSREDLLSVPGIGPKRADQMMRSLGVVEV